MTSALIQIADTGGKLFELVRTPTPEQVHRCLALIAEVEQLKPRQKIVISDSGGDTYTRTQFWKNSAYWLKHAVERYQCNPSEYISSEAAILAAVLSGAGVRNCRYEFNNDGSRRSLLRCEFVAPKRGAV